MKTKIVKIKNKNIKATLCADGLIVRVCACVCDPNGNPLSCEYHHVITVQHDTPVLRSHITSEVDKFLEMVSNSVEAQNAIQEAIDLW